MNPKWESDPLPESIVPHSNFRCPVNPDWPKHTSESEETSAQKQDLHKRNAIPRNSRIQSTSKPSLKQQQLLRTPVFSFQKQKPQQNNFSNRAQMPALFDRDTNVPTMSGQNPFQSLNATTASNGQENQAHKAEQHKQAKAAVDKRYVRRNRDCKRWNTSLERNGSRVVAIDKSICADQHPATLYTSAHRTPS